MKKIIALLLAVVMCFSLLVSCKDDANVENSDNPQNSQSSNQGSETTEPYEIQYTYNSYSSSLGTNWNPHTWEMTADDTILSYVSTPLADMTIKDSETGEYQWIFVAAEDIIDVTAEHQDDLVKYGCAETDATSGYVYEIKLRPEMKWEDGTPINADTYIYSMQQLLNPDMKNYRANLYYSGESAVAGGANYFYAGSLADIDNGSTGAITGLADLVKGADGVYTTADGMKVWIALATGLEWLGGYDLATYVGAYGADYFDVEAYDALMALADENGNVDITDETWPLLTAVISNPNWGEGEGYEPNYIYYQKQYEECTYDSVGCYKVDDYTIRYVCQTALDYYYFLTSCTSNWLVHEEMYEACKDTSGSLVTSKYNTSVDTTMSYGPYRIESLQDEKQIVFVQNENYWEYTKNEDGSLSSTTFFEVDGEYVPQYQTEKIVIDVMTDDAAKLAFLSGQLDDWAPAADEVVEYSTSEQLYQVDETYTMRLFFHTNLDSLKKMDEAGNTNSVVLSNTNFRNAMSLAIDRAEFVTATAGYKPGYFVLNSLYYYNVYEEPDSIYRNTDQAKQAICNLYGIEYGEGTIYPTLDDAYKSVTGYNLTEAKALFTQACQELVAEGLYKEGEDIVIEIGWMAGAMDSSNQQQVTLLNKYMNEALAGTGFGSIELKAVDNLADRYTDVINGVYAIGWGAWGGAAFYPFRNFQVYCDPDQYEIHEAGSWDPTSQTLTLTVKGKEVTMTWQEWSGSMVGTGRFANEDFETKLDILAAMEKEILKLYIFIPICTTTACSMLSYKLNYYTENYNIMYDFGGLRLMSYNYTNTEWAEFVTSQGGNVAY